MDKYCLLACSPWLSQPTFIYNSGPLAKGWYNAQRTGPFHINFKAKNCPTDLPIDQSDGDNFSTASRELHAWPYCSYKRCPNIELGLCPLDKSYICMVVGYLQRWMLSADIKMRHFVTVPKLHVLHSSVGFLISFLLIFLFLIPWLENANHVPFPGVPVLLCQPHLSQVGNSQIYSLVSSSSRISHN